MASLEARPHLHLRDAYRPPSGSSSLTQTQVLQKVKVFVCPALLLGLRNLYPTNPQRTACSVPGR